MAIVHNGGGSTAQASRIASRLLPTVSVLMLAAGAVAGAYSDRPDLGLPGQPASVARAQAGPDVSIIKRATNLYTSEATTYTAGSNLDFKLAVSNAGPGNATGLEVIDTLPNDITPTAAAGSGWNCTISDQRVTCTKPTLTVKTDTITIHATVKSSLTGQQTNTATVSADQDSTPGNNTSSVTLDPAPYADLDIEKLHDRTPTAGEQLTYDFTVTNLGPSDVPSFTVEDPLPTGLTFDHATDISCSPGLTCTGVVVAAGVTATFSITADVAADYPTGQPLENTATVATPTGIPDPESDNDTSTDQTDVDASADLSITKTSLDTTVIAGDETSYTIEVHNAGPSTDQPAGDIVVTDHLPAGVTYRLAEGPDWTCNDTQTVRCRYGPVLGPGADTTDLTLTVTVNDALRGSVTNTAQVEANVPDPDLSNNRADATVTVTGEADMSISKTHTGEVAAGADDEFTFTVTNHGPLSNTPSFVVSDTLDGQLTFKSASGDAHCTAVGQQVTCTGGSLAPTETARFTILVEVATTASGDISNTATVETPAGTTDPDPGNDSSTVVVQVVPPADLSVEKTHVGPFIAGQEGRYEIAVTNHGPSIVPADQTTVVDELPAGLRYLPDDDDAWTCAADGQRVTCQLGSALAVDETSTLTLRVRVAPTVHGELTNHATASSPITDPDPGTTGSDTVDVDERADLRLTKQAVGELTAGERATYRLTVTNHGGPSAAQNVTIRDELPPYLRYRHFDGDGWDCRADNQHVTCRRGAALGIDESATVELTVLVDQDAPGRAANRAAATFDGTDPTPAEVNLSTSVGREADLEAVLSHERKQYYSGDPVVFTYTVTNHGPSAATDVVLAHTLPDGIQFPTGALGDARATDFTTVDGVTIPVARTGAAAPGPLRCAASGSQRTECRADTLRTGTYQLRVEARIGTGFTGSLTSVLEVTSATPDGNPDNNRSVDVVPVLPADRRALPATGGEAALMLALAGGALLPTGLLLARVVTRRRVPHGLQPEEVAAG